MEEKFRQAEAARTSEQHTKEEELEQKKNSMDEILKQAELVKKEAEQVGFHK